MYSGSVGGAAGGEVRRNSERVLSKMFQNGPAKFREFIYGQIVFGIVDPPRAYREVGGPPSIADVVHRGQVS